MVQNDSSAVQKLLRDYVDRMIARPLTPHTLTATQRDMLDAQAFINAQHSYLQNQFGAQPHGRYWPSPQALHGSPTGVPGSGAGRAAASTQFTAAQQSGKSLALAAVAAARAESVTPPTIEEAGIRAGEIVAWRVWRLEPMSKVINKPVYPTISPADFNASAPYPRPYIVQEAVPATPLLRSTYKRTIWEPGQTMEAHADPTTQRHDNATRANAAYVGIFAWKTLGQLCRYIQQQFSLVHNDPFYGLRRPEYEGELFVTGQVILWGSVIEHEHGYRAQFAKPHRLFMVCDTEGYRLNEGLRVELCRLYGLPESGV